MTISDQLKIELPPWDLILYYTTATWIDFVFFFTMRESE